MNIESPYSVLTREQATKLTLQRLKALMSSVRAVISNISHTAGHRCCEICNEYIGGDWDTDVGVHLRPHQAYFDMLKDVSKSFPHEPNKVRHVKRNGR